MRLRLTAAALALATAVSGATAPEVRFESGRLWLRAHRTRASDLCESIRQRTGVTVTLDPPLAAAEMTIDIEGIAIERAIRSFASAIPGAAGHSLSYARGRDRRMRLVGVRVFAPGAARAPLPTPTRAPAVASAPALPSPVATADAEQRLQRMIDAGVPPGTAERVMELTREVQSLQATPVPGSLSPDDLGPEARAQLPALVDRGIPMERAVQMLLIQDRYRQALDELRRSQASGNALPDVTPPPAP
jgi:hypothetical protein